MGLSTPARARRPLGSNTNVTATAGLWRDAGRTGGGRPHWSIRGPRNPAGLPSGRLAGVPAGLLERRPLLCAYRRSRLRARDRSADPRPRRQRAAGRRARDAGLKAPRRYPTMATILVADDQADIRELLEITLSKRGHEVLPADSGTRALELAGRVVPDLAIVDVNMPGLEGTQVTRELRTRKATANVPIMLLTALSDEADILAGFAAGADDYVTKPFNPRELAARVEALLARGGSGSAPSSRPQGRLIAVAGPKGGCGRTTIAVNLALAMVEGHSSGAGR